MSTQLALAGSKPRICLRCLFVAFFLVFFFSHFLTRIAAAEEKSDSSWQTRWGFQQPMDRFFSEGIATGDINADGNLDLIVGPFWLQGPDFSVRHQIQAGEPVDPHGYAPHFFSFTDDFDADGFVDILHIGFPGQPAYWLRNPGDSTEPWERFPVIDRVDNESPTYADLVGDEARELVCSRGGAFGYATPDPANPKAEWIFHPISPADVAGGQFTHGLGLADIDLDGRKDLLEKNGWWQQPESLTKDPLWKFHPFAFSGPGGSQMHGHDVDGDGDTDVITALAAHGYGVAWYEQVEKDGKIDFVRHLIAGEKTSDTEFGTVFSQPHAVAIADLDGDGLTDIITGKRPWAHGPHGDAESLGEPVLYWFQCRRDGEGKTEFVPRVVSRQSGVGVDVLVADINRDGWLDILSANKRGVFVHRQDRTLIESQVARRFDIPASDAAAVPRPTSELPTSGLEPAQAAAQFTVPKGFAVDLIAGEPDLHQPVAFCFDGRGRIWVAEAHTYPNRAEESQGKDKIRIFEDLDGDGEFETKKTFAEGLNLISGLEVGFGGVYVGAAPYLMFIPDRDADDVPDGEPQILLDGFGYQDTHETLNAFNWGPDGWLYGCHGIFTYSTVGKPGSSERERTSINAGVWRYHPIDDRFEVFAEGTSNPWGLDFNQRGHAFITACVIPHAYNMIQGGRYQRQAGQHFDPYTFEDIKTIADHAHYSGNIGDHAWWGRNEPVDDDATSLAGGGHAHCGGLLYYGDNWPVSYRGNLLMHNIHGNRINNDILRTDGTGYIASHGRDLLFANDPWFRGINLKLGPDGAVYLIDWYDANACHRTTPEIWDRTNGRLYRVRYEGFAPASVDLTAMSNEGLVDLLSDENEWQVRGARMELMQRSSRGEDLNVVRAKLLAAVTSNSAHFHSNYVSDNHQGLDYLWTAHCIRPLDAGEVIGLLNSKDNDIRAWTIQLACERGLPSHEVVSRFIELSQTESAPIVRLYLASALQRLTTLSPVTSDLWAIASGLCADSDSQFDKNLPLLIWYGVQPLVAAEPNLGLQLARKSKIPKIRNFILRRAAADPALVNSLVSAMAAEADDAILKLMLQELTAAAPKLGKIEMPADWPKVIGRVASINDAGMSEQIQTLSVSFGDKSIFPILREIALDVSIEANRRRDALATLARGSDPELEMVSLGLIDDNALSLDALPLLGRFDTKTIPAEILNRYQAWDATKRRSGLDVLVSRPAHANALLDAIESGKVARTDVSAVHAGKIRQLGDDAMNQRLEELWGKVGDTPEDIARQIAEMQTTYTSQVIADANAHRGRMLYARSCGQCHQLFGEGENIGPDLTGANRGSLAYLLENIMAPNAIVGKDYQAVSVLTLDGRLLTGLVREQSDAAIVLHDAEKLLTIPRSEIELISETTRSVMPEGILQPFSQPEIADLFCYLQSSTQVLPAASLPSLTEDLRKLPEVVEGELFEGLQATSGSAIAQGMRGFRSHLWSGDEQLWWTGGKLGEKLTLPLEIATTGTYNLAAAFTKAPDYGIFQISLDGVVIVESLDLYESGRVISTGPLLLGTKELAAGSHQLEISLIGTNPLAVKAYMFGLDYLSLEQVEK